MSLDLQEVRSRDDSGHSTLASELLAAAEATRRAEVLVVRAQAALLAHFEFGDAVLRCGFRTLPDLALAMAGMGASMVRERLKLHRVLTRHSLLEATFLEGRITLCQVLAAEPIFRRIERVDDITLLHWIDIASSLPVRVLKREVRRIRDARGIQITADEEDEGQMVSFEAPLPFRIAWDQMMDLARKAIGYDAPVHVCLREILSEAGKAGLADPPPDDAVEPRTISIRPRSIASPPPAAVERARETLRRASTFLDEVRTGLSKSTPSSPHSAAEALAATELLRARASILFAHLIRDLRDTGARALLGYRSMADLVENCFGFSERTARNRVAESVFFEHAEGLEAAYARGEISLMQAHIVRKMAAGLPQAPFIERAAQVTFRQIQREGRIFELMRKCGLGDATTSPLPNPALVAALVAALGGDGEVLESRLRARGIPALPAGGSDDPAENCVLMDRIEAMVEILALRPWEEPVNAAACPDRQTFVDSGRDQAPPATDDPPASDRQTFVEPEGDPTAEPAADVPDADRQTFAAPGGDHTPEPAPDAPDPDRQTFAGSQGDQSTEPPADAPDADRQTFVEHREQVEPVEQPEQADIRFWVPSDTAADLLFYLDEARRDHGSEYPIWAAFGCLFAPVREEWLRRDPQRRAIRSRVIRRDDYRCIIPNCSSRKNLEDHHNKFRSLGGGDEDDNRSTLCHGHHGRGVHRGYVRITGRARHGLYFELGCRRDGPPLLVLRGEKIVRKGTRGTALPSYSATSTSISPTNPSAGT